MTMTTMFTRMGTGQRTWKGRVARIACTLALLCSLPAAMLPVHRSLAAGAILTDMRLTQSTSSTVAGQPVAFTVTAICSASFCPGGTVNFFEQLSVGGKPTLLGSAPFQSPNVSGTIVAHFSTTALRISAAPQYSLITAEYPGDANFKAAYAQVRHTVAIGKVAVSATSDFSQLPANVPFQLHATVTPQTPSTRTPTGSVTFTAIDPQGVSHNWGSAPLNANGQASLPICITLDGTYAVTVTYAGDGLYLNAISPSITVVAG